MAYMYLCKVNVNTNDKNIKMNYDKLQNYLNKVVLDLDCKLSVKLPKDEGKIKFITLDKNIELGYITGRLIKIFSDDVKVYDSKNDDIIDLSNDNLARNATFYFDIKNELVVFTVGKYFGRSQFCNYFEKLLNAHAQKDIFYVSLRIDEDSFRDKIYTFNRINRIDVTIIPKNPGRNDINNWYATPESLDDVNANELVQTYISDRNNEDGLNINSKHMDNIINGVSQGYGKMKVRGIGIAGDEFSVDSSKDMPEKRYIKNNEKASIASVMEYGKAFVLSVLKKRLKHNKKE